MPSFYAWHRGRSVTDLGMYLGHSAVRRLVMGNAPRPARTEELRAMEAVVEREAAHTLGLSTGLVYNPAVYCDSSELVALVRAFNRVKPGALFPHLRSESDRIEEALREAVDAAIEGGAGYCNEHTKIAGKHNSHRVVGVEAALKDAASSTRAIENMYPYAAGSTMGTALFPPEVRAGTRAEFIARVGDPNVRKEVCVRACVRACMRGSA